MLRNRAGINRFLKEPFINMFHPASKDSFPILFPQFCVGSCIRPIQEAIHPYRKTRSLLLLPILQMERTKEFLHLLGFLER
jgi:hypothetical protein